MKKILFFFNKLHATFWFVPVLIIIISILLAIGLMYVDQVITLSQDGLARYFLVNSADSARTILSTISGAMIGVAGTVFSVTLVVLTLASSQFGPRLIRNFMYVRLNQVVLGSYVATYLYCLFVLNAIKGSEGYSFVPAISILAAIIAAFINIILLIVFIHQIAISIQADKVISDISELISKQIQTLFPKKKNDESDYEQSFSVDQIKSKYTKSIVVRSPKNGYLQYIDNESLLKEIDSFKGLIELHFSPGDHLVKGIEIGQLYSNIDLDQEQLESIASYFIIGKTKDAQQDLEFYIHQIVEIASRALSPGINDPFTAIACLDALTATLCHLAQVRFPSRYIVNDEMNLRIITDALHFEAVLDSSLHQIRQFSAGSTAVIIRLMEALITINKFAHKEDHKKAVIKHAKMVLNIGKESIKEERDLHDLLERSKELISK